MFMNLFPSPLISFQCYRTVLHSADVLWLCHCAIYKVCEWDDMSFWTSWESSSFSSYSTFRLWSVMLNPTLIKQCTFLLEVTGFHSAVTKFRACTNDLNLVLFFFLSSAAVVFSTIAFLFLVFMHLMVLGQRNCNMLMQLAGRKVVFTVLRSDDVGGSIAHGWTFFQVFPLLYWIISRSGQLHVSLIQFMSSHSHAWIAVFYDHRWL